MSIGGDGRQRTLDGGSEKGSNWNVFMRRSWRGRPWSDLVNSFSWSAATSLEERPRSSSPGPDGVGPGAISSTADEKRTAGASSLGFLRVPLASAGF